MIVTPEDNLPEPEMYYLYIYNLDGYHNGKVEVLPKDIEEVFCNTLVKSKKEKRKVIITDEWDNCVFHMENGKVLFPPPPRT